MRAQDAANRWFVYFSTGHVGRRRRGGQVLVMAKLSGTVAVTSASSIVFKGASDSLTITSGVKEAWAF